MVQAHEDHEPKDKVEEHHGAFAPQCRCIRPSRDNVIPDQCSTPRVGWDIWDAPIGRLNVPAFLAVTKHCSCLFADRV
jgi:hypothetical protein